MAKRPPTEHRNMVEKIKTVHINYKILRAKFEPKPGLELRPPDLQPGALPLGYPGLPASSPSNSPLEITATNARQYDP